MIRGVNRQIIEVNDTQNEYFERAIFFVRPECSDESQRKLHSQAVQYTESQTYIPQKVAAKKKKYLVSRRALWLMLAITTTATIVLSFMQFMGR